MQSTQNEMRRYHIMRQLALKSVNALLRKWNIAPWRRRETVVVIREDGTGEVYTKSELIDAFIARGCDGLREKADAQLATE